MGEGGREGVEGVWEELWSSGEGGMGDKMVVMGEMRIWGICVHILA